MQAAIVAAFGGLRRPSAERIALHECEECAEVRTAFAQYDWEHVPDEVIEQHKDALPLLSAEAFAYYLPAYLLYGIRHFSPDSAATELTIYSLAPTAEDEDDEERAEWKRGKLKNLTRGQIEAVCGFLDLVAGDESFRVYLGDVEPGRRRLLRLWEQRWNS